MSRYSDMCVAAVLCVLVFAGGCGARQGTDRATPWPAGNASYDFSRPSLQIELPEALDEISGLVVLGDGTLGAVQDEEGILYVLDEVSGEIVDERSFGSSGDYEAVALGAGSLFVLESDGTLHRFGDWSEAELEGTEVTLDLPRQCDAEGLRYDPEGARLLVSCKENAGPGLGTRKAKAIFAFDVDGRRLSAEPAYALDTRSFNVSVEDHPVNEAVRSVLSERIDLSGFKPSELAVHPLTGELFVLSSVREAVLSVVRDGSVTGVWKLPDALLDQPEAMDFLPNGDVFIASEAAGRKDAVLLRFDYLAAQTSPAE